MAIFDNWTTLSDYSLGRRKFDPSDVADLKELAYFKKNKTWKDTCPFYLEWPFKDIVTMCQTKYTDYMLKKLVK
jgi:hypothetical protein